MFTTFTVFCMCECLFRNGLCILIATLLCLVLFHSNGKNGEKCLNQINLCLLHSDTALLIPEKYNIYT